MKNLLIFGTGQLAEVAYYYFMHDSQYKVTAFVVDKDYISSESFCSLPVVPLDEVQNLYGNDKFVFFIAIGYSRLNANRREKYLYIKSLGYKFANYISSKAIILNDNNIGENCFVLENNVIQPYVRIGNNVILWSGNHIGHHSVIHDHTFITSHVVISGGVEIGEQCFLGVNATVRDNIKIGDRCIIGAGSLLLVNADSEGIYPGKATPRAMIPSSMVRDI